MVISSDSNANSLSKGSTDPQLKSNLISFSVLNAIYSLAGGTAAVQSDEEINSEAEEWEEQQIKKGMPVLPDIIGMLCISI